VNHKCIFPLQRGCTVAESAQMLQQDRESTSSIRLNQRTLSLQLAAGSFNFMRCAPARTHPIGHV